MRITRREQSVPIAAHPLASSDPPRIIESARQLDEMIACLRSAGSFAFDSEFIRERSYESRLCLVQVATAEKVFLVDPLGGQEGRTSLDLSSLWELLVSPAVEKIVLAGQQDFDAVVQLTGGKRAPANVMDLQIAAGFVHVDYPLSLSRVIEEFAGVPLGKGLAFSHWDRRPLSASQVRYAANDVRYLPAAWDAIGKRLAALDRTAWAREECASALEDLAIYRPAPETLYLRVRRRDGLNPRQLAVLRELAIVRDQAARCEDVPVRTLLRDEILLVLARWPVRNLEDLDGHPRAAQGRVELHYGRQIVDATARALALPDDQLPQAEYGRWAPSPQPSGCHAVSGQRLLHRAIDRPVDGDQPERVDPSLLVAAASRRRQRIDGGAPPMSRLAQTTARRPPESQPISSGAKEFDPTA